MMPDQMIISDSHTESIASGNAVFEKFSRLVISPKAMAHNLDVIRSITRRTIIAIVKENGYGMGLRNEYEILDRLGIRFYGVTNTQEALALRRFGCSSPILLMSPVAEYTDCLELARQDIIFCLEDEWQIPLLQKIYEETGISPHVHIKFETGMGRYGFRWNRLPDLKALTEHLTVEGCFTHLAGRPKQYQKQVMEQKKRFLHAVEVLESMGVPSGLKHISNSTAIMTFGDLGLDAVRAGSVLLGKAVAFGRPPLGKSGLKTAVWLEAPVYEVRTFHRGDTIGYQSGLTLKRDTRLALVRTGHSDGVCLGYADMPQYFFHGCLHLLAMKLLPNRYRKTVTINGKPAPMAGCLGVAHMMIDVTDIPCAPGDMVKMTVNPLLVHPAVEKIILKA